MTASEKLYGKTLDFASEISYLCNKVSASTRALSFGSAWASKSREFAKQNLSTRTKNFSTRTKNFSTRTISLLSIFRIERVLAEIAKADADDLQTQNEAQTKMQSVCENDGKNDSSKLIKSNDGNEQIELSSRARVYIIQSNNQSIILRARKKF